MAKVKSTGRPQLSTNHRKGSFDSVLGEPPAKNRTESSPMVDEKSMFSTDFKISLFMYGVGAYGIVQLFCVVFSAVGADDGAYIVSSVVLRTILIAVLSSIFTALYKTGSLIEGYLGGLSSLVMYCASLDVILTTLFEYRFFLGDAAMAPTVNPLHYIVLVEVCLFAISFEHLKSLMQRFLILSTFVLVLGFILHHFVLEDDWARSNISLGLFVLSQIVFFLACFKIRKCLAGLQDALLIKGGEVDRRVAAIQLSASWDQLNAALTAQKAMNGVLVSQFAAAAAAAVSPPIVSSANPVAVSAVNPAVSSAANYNVGASLSNPSASLVLGGSGLPRGVIQPRSKFETILEVLDDTQFNVEALYHELLICAAGPPVGADDEAVLSEEVRMGVQTFNQNNATPIGTTAAGVAGSLNKVPTLHASPSPTHKFANPGASLFMRQRTVGERVAAAVHASMPAIPQSDLSNSPSMMMRKSLGTGAGGGPESPSATPASSPVAVLPKPSLISRFLAFISPGPGDGTVPHGSTAVLSLAPRGQSALSAMPRTASAQVNKNMEIPHAQGSRGASPATLGKQVSGLPNSPSLQPSAMLVTSNTSIGHHQEFPAANSQPNISAAPAASNTSQVHAGGRHPALASHIMGGSIIGGNSSGTLNEAGHSSLHQSAAAARLVSAHRDGVAAIFASQAGMSSTHLVSSVHAGALPPSGGSLALLASRAMAGRGQSSMAVSLAKGVRSQKLLALLDLHTRYGIGKDFQSSSPVAECSQDDDLVQVPRWLLLQTAVEARTFATTLTQCVQDLRNGGQKLFKAKLKTRTSSAGLSMLLRKGKEMSAASLGRVPSPQFAGSVNPLTGGVIPSVSHQQGQVLEDTGMVPMTNDRGLSNYSVDKDDLRGYLGAYIDDSDSSSDEDAGEMNEEAANVLMDIEMALNAGGMSANPLVRGRSNLNSRDLSPVLPSPQPSTSPLNTHDPNSNPNILIDGVEQGHAKQNTLMGNLSGKQQNQLLLNALLTIQQNPALAMNATPQVILQALLHAAGGSNENLLAPSKVHRAGSPTGPLQKKGRETSVYVAMDSVSAPEIVGLFGQTLLYRACPPVPPPEDAPSEAAGLLSFLGRWELDILSLDKLLGGPTLAFTGTQLASQFVKQLPDVPTERVTNFLMDLEVRYKPTCAYHNNLHAAEVVNGMYFFVTKWSEAAGWSKNEQLRNLELLAHGNADLNASASSIMRHSKGSLKPSGLSAMLSMHQSHSTLHSGSKTHQTSAATFAVPPLDPLLALASLMAAAMHDVGHSGRTNRYQIATGSVLSHIYNDRSPLENFHLAVGFTSLRSEKCNIFADLPPERVKRARQLIVDIVLQTDTSTHMQANAALREKCVWDDEKDSDVNQALGLMLRAADIGHAAKPLAQHRLWSGRVCLEFWAEGAREKELKLPLSPPNDRDGDLGKGQGIFIDFVAWPLFEIVGNWFQHEAVNYLLENIRENKQYWISGSWRDDEELMKFFTYTDNSSIAPALLSHVLKGPTPHQVLTSPPVEAVTITPTFYKISPVLPNGTVLTSDISAPPQQDSAILLTSASLAAQQPAHQQSNQQQPLKGPSMDTGSFPAHAGLVGTIAAQLVPKYFSTGIFHLPTDPNATAGGSNAVLSPHAPSFGLPRTASLNSEHHSLPPSAMEAAQPLQQFSAGAAPRSPSPVPSSHAPNFGSPMSPARMQQVRAAVLSVMSGDEGFEED